MLSRRICPRLAVWTVLAAVSLSMTQAGEGGLVLKKGDRVAIVGDSITEQKLYSKYIELYLIACMPELDLKCMQYGWSGETAGGFKNRMENDLKLFEPNVVTTCYGMNDGGYKPFNEGTGNTYYNAMNQIVTKLKASGATVVVGSPGAVDFKFFKGGGEQPKMYNATLASLRDIAKKIADEQKMPFANVYDAMYSAMEKAKAALGENYDVCGKDGFHPGPNGHLLMAYAFLKGMGLDGNLGTITVDMKGASSAEGGHKVLSGENGKAEIESTRYPFCFNGDVKSSSGTLSVAPFVPFNQDLNRLTLIVKNLEGEKAQVNWGGQSKSFSKAELEKGINLAEQFMAANPFSEAFRNMDTRVSQKQSYETPMIKGAITGFPGLAKTLEADKEIAAKLEVMRKSYYEIQDSYHRYVRAGMVPVKHAISVTPEK
ncbi:MAG TPA: SGNH/GDSL hydrolase family protein [Planctomycetota bacterium]|nr:SGNH/GDSL hydrolase family protein [Planctomycetota bacterium]